MIENLGMIANLQQYRETLFDYYRLSKSPELSESEADRFGEILEQAEQDDTLSLLLNEIDEISYQKLALLDRDLDKKSDTVRRSISPQQWELDRFINEVLVGEDSHQILPQIKRRMQQYHLSPQYHSYEIFTEAYLRIVKRIEAGEIIDSLPASLKITILRITQEYSRKQKSQRNLKKKLETTTDIFEEISICDDEIESNLLKLQAALKQLRPQELLILRLRVVEGFSWSEIGDYLARSGEAKENTPNLRSVVRKKGHRALQRLRKYFSA